MNGGLLAFAIALVLAVAFTVPIRAFAVHVGMVDKPAPRKMHLRPTPLLGGVSIYAAALLAFLVACFAQVQNLRGAVGIFLGATLLLLVGTLDDRGLLHHQIKLFVAMPLAAAVVLASGIRLQLFAAVLPSPLGSLADAGLTILWITGITASFSILDYMDGICAGIAAIAMSFLGILAFLNGQTLVGVLACAVAGAAFGFLIWNFNPAKIFMGDGGAMFLGFLAATVALMLRVSGASQGARWAAPVLVLAVPIFDTTLVSVSRLLRGLVPFASPGKDHTGHRLANSGLGVRGSALTMYFLCAVGGGLGVLSTHLSRSQIRNMVLILLAAGFAAIVLLESLPYERQERKLPFKERIADQA